MADIVTRAKRSAMMAAVRGKNTKPELAVRRLVHRAGYRFRLHRKDLPGAPDIVLPSRRIAIFVHGCFWHGHSGCRYATVPKTRRAFWVGKIKANRLRDARAKRVLQKNDWRVVVIWECDTRNAEQLRKALLPHLVC